ncbi:MAG: hypothetical protein WC025_04305 [Candidatus Magasanikbacteria bacterium]
MVTLNEPNNVVKSQNYFAKNKKHGKIIIICSLFFLLLLASIYFLFSYLKAQKELKYLKDPAAQEAVTKVENEKLINTVGKLIELPVNEEPIIGTVQDAEALARDQQFFANAKNGDRVLIYKNTAVIYRPEINKLINMGPVYINATSTTNISNNK